MADADGFLGRWARRKNAALQGEALPEPVLAKSDKLLPNAAPAAPVAGVSSTQPEAQAPEAPPLTLQDARELTPDSDFSPFMNRAVQPEVRNAAMKQLFSDPHFNVMDGLDIYIDDYSKPDPLPLSMLKQMASAKFLKLVEEEEAPQAQEAPATSPVKAYEANKPANPANPAELAELAELAESDSSDDSDDSPALVEPLPDSAPHELSGAAAPTPAELAPPALAVPQENECPP